MNDPFDLERITAETFVKRVHFFDSIDSTNTAALRATSTASETAELFLTDQQTSGRGRGENQWWSTDGSLTFSLLAPPLPIPEERIALASLATGVAICQAVERFLPAARVRLKWPNDVFIDGKKAAGILIESTAQKPRRLVVGIGLNVNHTFDGAPQELKETATSLQNAMGQPFDRTEVLIECLKRLEQRLNQLATGSASLTERWQHYSLLTGKQVHVETDQKQLVGLCKGIAADGALLIETAEGITPCYTGVIVEFT